MDEHQFRELARLSDVDESKLKHVWKLAQIAAFAETKEKLVRWAVIWVTLISVGLAVLVFFGIDQMVKSNVVIQVKSSVEGVTESIQTGISGVRNDSLKALAKAETLHDQYESYIENVEPLVQALSGLSDQVKVPLVLNYISANFYKVTDLDAYLDMQFADTIAEISEETNITPDKGMEFPNLHLYGPVTGSEAGEGEAVIFEPESLGIPIDLNYVATYKLDPWTNHMKNVSGRHVKLFQVDHFHLVYPLLTEPQAGRYLRFVDALESVTVRLEINGINYLEQKFENLSFTKRPGTREEGPHVVIARLEVDEAYSIDPQSAFEHAIAKALSSE